MPPSPTVSWSTSVTEFIRDQVSKAKREMLKEEGTRVEAAHIAGPADGVEVKDFAYTASKRIAKQRG